MTHVKESNKFITNALAENIPGETPKNKILIHCFAGKSRATSFLLAYMIKVKKINLKDGLEKIWAVRPIAAPNPGFMIQLKALEKDTLNEVSECDVMQGMWKDKLDALKKEKEKKMEAGEDVSPLKVPDTESLINNVNK